LIGRDGGSREGRAVFYTSPRVILAGAIRRGFEDWESPEEGRGATSEGFTAREGLGRIRAEAFPEPYLKGREK
jgi:hypothetical protein